MSSVFQIENAPSEPGANHIHDASHEHLDHKTINLSRRDELKAAHEAFLMELRTEKNPEKLKSLALSRKEKVRDFVRAGDYEGIREFIMDKNDRDTLPENIKQDVEEDVSGKEGILHILHVDYPDDTTEVGYDISTPNGPERIYIDTRNHPNASELHPNSVLFDSNYRVTLRKGIKLENEIVTPYEAIGLGEAVIADTGSIISPTVAGVTYRKGIAVMINYTADPITPYSAANVSRNLFAADGTISLNRYMIENSFGAMGFTGNVESAYVTINITSTGGCNYGSAQSQADAILQSRGYNLSNYQHRLYVMARSSYMSCGWSGLAYMPGSTSWYMTDNVGVYGHEIIHNLGAHHAATYNCGTKSIATSGCSMSEYGDVTDVMGGARTVHLNGAHKVQIGYMPSSRVIVAKTSGDYTIAPIEVSTTTPQVIKIPVSSTRNYYIDYRQPLGLDTNSAITAYTQGVSITEWTSGQTKRLDATPGDGSFANGTLIDGAKFIDVENNIQIEQLSHGANGAVVRVSFSCTKNAPTVTVSPDQTSSVGGTSTYTVSVTNNDTAFCPPTTFSMSGNIVSPLTGVFSAPSITINPATTGSITYKVSANTAIVGSYPITLLVSDGGTVTITTIRNQNIIENIAPTISSCTYCGTTTPVALGSKGVTLNMSATDDNGAPAVSIYMNGILKASGTSSVSTKVQPNRKDPAGTKYIVDYVAKDTVGGITKKSITLIK